MQEGQMLLAIANGEQLVVFKGGGSFNNYQPIDQTLKIPTKFQLKILHGSTYGIIVGYDKETELLKLSIK